MDNGLKIPTQTSSAVGGLKIVGGNVGCRLDIRQMYHSLNLSPVNFKLCQKNFYFNYRPFSYLNILGDNECNIKRNKIKIMNRLGFVFDLCFTFNVYDIRLLEAKE